jgi:Secretion system C-terminal sorting domain
MKKLLLLFTIFSALSFNSFASHLMGGEITWECLSSGKYVFTLKVYRDCNGTTIGASPQSLITANGCPVSNITMNYVFPSTDMSPVCNNPLLQKSCGPITPAGSFNTVSYPNNNGAVEEMIWKSNPITIAGIPGPNGWVFSWSLCCRNAAITNLSNPDSFGMCLRSKMFAYNQNGIGTTTNPCFDSSPQFAERPVSILCTGYPFTYSQNAYDKDLDSLAYSWDKPLVEYNNSGVFDTTNPLPMNFQSGFSYTSPFPNNILDTNNIAATLNPFTGEINYTSFTQGNYVLVVKVSSFKNGQLVAEIYREYQHVLLPCGLANQPPIVTPPFNFSASFDTIITAGDFVSFNFSASDLGTIPGTPPTPQSVAIFASGEQFDTTNFSSSSLNCNKPPCAGLTSTPGMFTTTNASLQFNWQTSCENLVNSNGDYLSSRTFTFHFAAQDDYCPAPAIQGKTVSITVLGTDVLDAPHAISAAIQSNGTIGLNWSNPADPNATFNSYLIYGSSALSGPYTCLDTVINYSTDSASISYSNLPAVPLYFYLKTISGCHGQIASENSDTASVDCTIAPPQPYSTDVSLSGDVLLRWHLPSNSNATFSTYYLYASALLAGPYTLMDSVTNYLTDSLLIPNTTANSNPLYFYMQSSSVCGAGFLSGNSDTISTLFSAAKNIGNNKTEIKWNTPHNAATSNYSIFRGLANTWTLLATINSNQFVDSLSLCNQQVFYKVISNDTQQNFSSAPASSIINGPAILLNAVIGSPEYINVGRIELTVDGGTPDYIFDWSNGMHTQNISELAIGLYSVKVTDASGCSFNKENIEIKNEIDPTSIFEKNTFIVSPNPANDLLTIIAIEEAELRVFSSKGEMMQKEKIQKGKNTVNTQSLPSGTYLLKFKSEQKTKTITIQVIH